MVHRWIRGEDLVALLWILRQMLERSGSIERFFLEGYRDEHDDVGPALDSFSHARARARPAARLRPPAAPAGRVLFLSAAVRRKRVQAAEPVPSMDGEDATKWTSASGQDLPAAALIVPLDTHVIRLGRCLRLTRYTSPGWKMAADITASLRRLDPRDPVRFDFSLCHVGMMNACGFGRKQGDTQCPLKGLCRPRVRRASG